MDEEKTQRQIRLIPLCSLIGGRIDLFAPKVTVNVTLHVLLLSD